MNRILAMLCAVVALLAGIVVVGAIFGEGEIIVWRFVLAIVVFLGALYGTVQLWKRGSKASV
ncbi:MAG: hypothetical protein M3285_13755 [Actinomycetota bacterium]|nr:hypothetical protein [Actinomycetota bacterium]